MVSTSIVNCQILVQNISSLSEVPYFYIDLRASEEQKLVWEYIHACMRTMSSLELCFAGDSFQEGSW